MENEERIFPNLFCPVENYYSTENLYPVRIYVGGVLKSTVSASLSGMDIALLNDGSDSMVSYEIFDPETNEILYSNWTAPSAPLEDKKKRRKQTKKFWRLNEKFNIGRPQN